MQVLHEDAARDCYVAAHGRENVGDAQGAEVCRVFGESEVGDV